MPEQGRRKGLRILILLAVVVLVIAAAAIVVAVHFSGENFVSTKLVLPDGTVLALAGTDYGTNHVLGSRFMRWAARTPPAVQAGLKKLFGARAVPQQTLTTATPMLVMWLDSPPPGSVPPVSPGWYEAYLADTNGFISGASQNFWPGLVMPLQFSAFPRRQRFFSLHVISRDAQNHVKDLGTFNIANPEYRNYPQWQPETLPVTKQVGDVEATLEQFKTGQGPSMSFSPLTGGGNVIEFPKQSDNVNNGTAVWVKLRSLSDTNQVWQVEHVELSDATGNKVTSQSMSWGGTGTHANEVFVFQPGLWTNETAWKLRCEIRRNKGFAPGELFTFKNVPLPTVRQTNSPGWSTNINGVTITLDHIIREPPITNMNNGWSSSQMSTAQFVISGAPKDFHLELLKALADNGTNLEPVGWSSSDTTEEYNLNVPLDVNSIDFTLAAHQGRWVEFMVKPETGPARFELPGP